MDPKGNRTWFIPITALNIQLFNTSDSIRYQTYKIKMLAFDTGVTSNNGKVVVPPLPPIPPHFVVYLLVMAIV